MLKITKNEQLAELIEMPVELMTILEERIFTLDESYGEDRDESVGGLLYIVQNLSDIDKLKENGVDIRNQIYEYAETIETSKGAYTELLFLIGDDYAIIVFIPQSVLNKVW